MSEDKMLHYIVSTPKCPNCDNARHQKSTIILYNNEARHSVRCLVCSKEYSIERDKLHQPIGKQCLSI